MKPGTIHWLLLAVAVLLITIVNAKDQESLQAVTTANNLFSSELYETLRKSSKENLIVSPVSVSTAFAMLQAGARGKSQTSIRSSFHFPADNQLNSGYHELLHELRNVENVTLEMVNRIYPAESFTLNPQFSNTLKSYYDAEPQQLNYAANEEAAGTINNFVSNATHDKIRELIKSSDLDPNTTLVLVNAIYFKGNWNTPFKKENTKKADFFVSENEQPVQVDTMNLETDMWYGDIPELDAQAVSLSYTGGSLNMIILLPNQRYGLAAMEEKLKDFPLRKIVQMLSARKVNLLLPKFRLESEIDLQESLTQLGLGDLFTPMQADLSGIPDSRINENLFISKAIQKAFIEVNEEGSEVAGATGIVIKTWAYINTSSQPTVFFKADHPFSFILVKNSFAGELPLFQGRLTRAA